MKQLSIWTILLLTSTSQAFGATKSSKKQSQPEPPPPAAEMRIDPGLLKSYKTHASSDASRAERANTQFISIEATAGLHQFAKFSSHSEYFDTDLNAGEKSAMIPQVWIGHPTGAVWFASLRARAGIEMSYFMKDGAQTTNNRPLEMTFRDNIAVNVIPILASGKLSIANSRLTFGGVAPWASAGFGAAMIQVSGNLDGASQSTTLPITKLQAGLEYPLSTSGDQAAISLGAFKVAGSSTRAQWDSTGYLVGASVNL